MGKLADRLLAGVDQVGIDFVVVGEGADAQHPVLRLQGNGDAGGHMVRHQRRDADAQVDVKAVAQLARGAGGHLVAGPAPRAGIWGGGVWRCHWLGLSVAFGAG